VCSQKVCVYKSKAGMCAGLLVAGSEVCKFESGIVRQDAPIWMRRATMHPVKFANQFCDSNRGQINLTERSPSCYNDIRNIARVSMPYGIF